MSGLRARLAQLVLAATLPLLALIAYDNVQHWRSEVAEADAQAMRAAVAIAADTGRRLASARDLLAYLAAQPQVRALDASRCHPLFADQAGLFPEFANVAISRRDGSTVCSALPQPPGTSTSVSLPLYLGPTLRSNAFTVGQMSRGVFSGRQIVMVAHPIAALDAGAAPAAVIVAGIDLAQLPMAKGLASLPAGADARLIDGNKRLMASSGGGMDGVGASVAALPWLAGLRAGAAARGRAPDDAGIDRIYAAAPVPGAGWHAVVALRGESVFGPLRRRAWVSAAIAVGALALSGLLAWAIGRRTVRPVEAIAAAARRAATPGVRLDLCELGELAPENLGNAPPELRSLAGDFCAMLAARDAAEQALRDGELRLKRVIDNLHDGLILVHDGQPAQWNRAAVAMAGFASADECPRDFAAFRQQFDVIALDGTPLPPEAWPMAQLLRGLPVDELELVLARRDVGWRRVMRCNGMRLSGPDGRPTLFLSVIDVTESRAALAALQRSLERLRATGELAQVGGWALDVASGRIELSDELRQIVGVAPGTEITTANALDFYAPEERAGIDAATRAVIVDGTPWDREAELIVGADRAQRRWVRTSARAVREHGRTVRVIGAVQDVTVLHDSQQRALKGEALLRVASQLMRLGGWEANLADGHMSWSDEVADIHDMPRGSALPVADGLTTFEGEARERIAAAFDACARDGTPYDLELPKLTAQGRPVWVRTIGQPVYDAAGRIVRVRGAILDITERKQAERALADQQHNLEAQVRERTAELARARDAAEQANRAKSNFLANMSHEIRTPMNAIIGLTHLLREDVAEPRARARLSKVNAAAHHLLGVINDILDLSKIESGRATLAVHDFAVGDVISHTLDMVRQRAQDKGLKLAFALDAALPRRLRGDAMRLEQVLVNYLSNAVKFSEHGTITLRLRHWPDAVGGDGGSDDGAIGLRLEVQDEGMGLSAEQRERLFQPFSQADESTSRRYGGTGLGLAIVTRLAAMMGGEAGVDSRLGVGSTFWITARVQPAAGDALAAERPGDGAAAASPEAALRSRFPGARVLLADDDPINQMVIEELLRRLGLEVDVVDGGEQAIHRAHDHDYALVLMDMQMPVIDGLAATRAIRELPGRGRLPIVALTANAFAEDRERCLAAGMNDHMSKPVEPHTFAACLLRWLTWGKAQSSA